MAKTMIPVLSVLFCTLRQQTPLAAIRQGREVEKGHVVQEAERLKDAERQREQDSEERHRDRGMDHGM